MTTNRLSLPPIRVRASHCLSSNLDDTPSITRDATGAFPPTPGSCSKCRQAVKDAKGMSIHATLAYSRCRCHRVFQSKLQRYQMCQRPASRLSRGSEFTECSYRQPASQEISSVKSRAKMVNRSIVLPDVSVQSRTSLVASGMSTGSSTFRHQTQLLPSSSSKSLLQKSVSRLRADW